jgi:hydrogenase maturation protease
MPTLLIGCGNPLRGDDGVAPAVLRLIRPTASREIRSVQQLTPELAAEIASFDRVIFVDADLQATALAVDPVATAIPHSPLTHASTPAEIVALSRALFGFTGEALVCRIPVSDFSAGALLTPSSSEFVREGAARLEGLS